MRIPSGVDDGFCPIKGALVVFLCFGLATPVPANPSGRAVRAGEIRFQQSGDTLRVIQGTQQGIIDWDTFSIASGETTRFTQPNSQSATLNRVTGASLSRIDGRLLANGRVFLLNSNGIVIGRDGVVDVAGFAASTLDVSNESFLAGGDLEFRGGSEAAVLNLGSISAFDGDIFLVAATVENAGSLSAPRGTAGLAAGNDVLIRESGSERIFVRGAGGGKKENGVINKGTVEANVAELKAYGGNVYGMAVKNEGRVAATGVTREGGQIFLRAGGGKVRSTGTLKARSSSGSGGKIKVDSGREDSRTEIGGTVDASGEAGAGGEIVILGNEIEVFEGALILNDGATMGGVTYIGGGLRGQDPEFSNAETVTVGNGAMISANALGSGDGGRITIFAKDTATVYGSLSSQGGADGGNGGFIELSGQNQLFVPDLVGQIRLSSASGNSGTLLLDPTNIHVYHGTTPGIMGATISDGALMDVLASFPILLETSELGGAQAGDITFASDVNVTWSTPYGLSFVADRDFILNGGAVINSTGSGLFSATATRAISLGSGSSITTINGALTLSANTAGTHLDTFDGIDINAATVQVTGGGNLTLTGKGGLGGGADPSGVVVRAGGAVIGGTSGLVTVTGTGGSGTSNDTGSSNLVGVMLEGANSRITSSGAPVQVTGIGGTSTGPAAGGVLLINGGLISAGGNGSVVVTGTGGAGTRFSYGVDAVHSGSMITSNNGTVTVTGTGGTGTLGDHWGVLVQLGAMITAGGTNAVTVNGTGGFGAGGNNHGVVARIDTGGFGRISSGGGNITVTGTEGTGGTGNLGINVQNGGTITTATNGGNITLIADRMGLADTVATNSAGTVTLRQKTSGIAINLGSTNDTTAGDLELSESELDAIVTGTLQIGNNNTGLMTVSSAISHGNNLSLTTGAGVTVNNAITMDPGKNLTLNAIGTINLANTNADLAATGSGVISMTTARNILLASGASVTTVNGNLTLSANQQVTPSTGNFAGISINGGTLESTGTGVLSAIGRGGDTGGSNIGISVSNGGRIIGGTSAITLLTGSGGLSGGSSNIGVQVTGANSLLSSHGSNLSVFGYGGGTGATSGANSGVHVISGGVITSGALSGVTVEGTGGGGEGLNNKGVWVSQAGTAGTITSGGGFVSITGIGGGVLGSTNNQGVDQAGSSTVIGTGGGPLTITGTGGANTATEAIRLSGTVSTSGNQPITFIGDSYDGALVTINSGTGTTSFRPLSNAFAIGLGGADVGGTTLGLTDAELDRITAGTVQIGNSNTGLITVSSSITHGNHLSLITGSGVTINSGIVMNPNRNLDVESSSTANGAISVGAALAASGTGTISLTTPRNISFLTGASASTGAGSLTLSANAAGTTSGFFEGVMILDGASLSSGTGTISVTGRGGDSFSAGNHGIRVDNTASVSSTGGNIFLTGEARGGAEASPTQEGILVRGNITTTGSGNITLSGTGGNAISGNLGVHLFDTVTVSTENGNILITGVSGSGGNSPGIQIADFGSSPVVITSTTGTITLSGDGSAGEGPGILAFGNGVSVGGGTGAVVLEAIGDISFISGAEIGTIGSGAVSLSATQTVALGSGASVSTVNGNLSISANQQMIPTMGNFAGVAIDSATVQTTGSGVLSISGRGGDTGGSNFGINILNGGVVSGGTTGTTLLNGTGGGDAGNGNSGVNVIGSGSRIISSGSNLSISGTGGAGTQSRGVFLGSGAQISTTSAGGAITLTGIGTTGDNIGIEMNSGAITSSSGIILLDGLGAGAGRSISSNAATDSLGSVSSHVILKSSGGNVNIDGTVNAPGLLLRDATTAGNAGFALGNLSNDVNFLAANGTGSSSRIGSVDFSDADGFDVSTVGGVNGIAANGLVDLISAGGGLETLRVSRAISSLGGSINLSGYDVTVSNSAITTSGTGTIDLTAARSLLVETDSALTVVNGDLTLKGNTSVAPLDGDFSGIVISNSILTTSGQGDIALTGVGGGNASFSTSIVDGIRLIGDAVIQSTGGGNLAGGISLLGTGGTGNVPNTGVNISGANTLISSVVGQISITGDGGDSVSGGGDGVVVGGGASIRSTGSSETAAQIVMEGTGGSLGSGNRGLVIQDTGTEIKSVDGLIFLTGNGGGQVTGELNRGISISGATIESTGFGTIDLTGNGGLGFNRNDGVHLQSGATLQVSNGDIFIGGTAGGGLGYGIFATPTSGAISVTGIGAVSITGSGMNAAGVNLSNQILGGANAAYIDIESTAHDVIVQSTTNATGDILFKSERNISSGGQVTSGTGSVQFFGRDVTIDGLVTATAGDITVEVGRGITSPGSGGVAAINADFVHGGNLSFLGGAGGEDTVTYAGYAHGPIVFDFDLLSGIENLVGTALTTDQLEGPALAGSFLFTGSDVFDVNGVIVSGFENILGGAEDDLFSFNSGGSLTGTLNGGGGLANEISYAGFATGAVLNLEVGASSGILGGFSNIQAFNGSPQIDTVIGLQAPSIYQFTGGLLNVGGFEVGGFDNLFAGPGNDSFIIGPGGGIPGLLSGGAGFDVLNYSGYGAPVSVNLGVPNATGFGGVTALESYLGSAFEDSFTGSNGNDTFTINSINAGNINGASLFASFEHLKGGPGTDRFLFLNQATVGSVDGGLGSDLLEIDDRTLGGTNTYTITNNQISRNPTYIFSGLEGIKLLLGPGNDTIVTRANGTVQTFDGGPGNDILDMGPGVFLTGSPMVLGNSTIIHSGFEGPLAPNTPPGEVLQVQTGNVPRPQQDIGFQVEDRFTPGVDPGMTGQNVLQALSQAGGNAFSAVLAGQAVVLQIDGQQYLIGVPANLDGSAGLPPAEIIERLRESLRADGWTELADAIGFEGPMTLVSIDGPFPVDLSSPIPPELLAVLGGGMLLDAAQELFDALEMVVFVPVTAADGAVSIFAVAIPIDDATRAILLEQLSQAAFTELSDALEL